MSSSIASSARWVFCGIALVAAAHLVGEHLDLHPVPLGVPARRPHLGVGVEPDLELGMRRHDLADVAALDHRVALLGELTLALAHHLAHLLVPRDDGHGRVDLGRADLGRHVVAADEDAAALAELDRMLAREVRRAPERRRARPRCAAPAR